MKYFKVLLLVCLLATGQQLMAQTKTAAKYKPPKLYTQLGIYKDSAFVTDLEADQVLLTPLKIFDDKKTAYTVSSYQFAYRKLGVTEDEATGKTSPIYTLNVALFKTTPVPANWIQLLKEQIKPGDEIIFFDVIAKDAQGRVMYSPDLKLKIKK